MRENELRKFLNDDEMDKIYIEAHHLKEDIEFFTMYAKRNKKSKFNFDIIPDTVGSGSKLLKYLYHNCYIYFKDELSIMLTEISVVQKLADTLNRSLDVMHYDEEEMKEICAYFQKQYNINLPEYISDFIGCSYTCEKAEKELKLILNQGVQKL